MWRFVSSKAWKDAQSLAILHYILAKDRNFVFTQLGNFTSILSK